MSLRQLLRLAVLLGVAAVLARPAAAQPYFQQSDVEAAPEAGYAFAGDVDVDGEWAVAGALAPPVPRAPGVVYVFRRSGTSWSQHSRLTCPDVADACPNFGEAVAVSGTTLAVGNGGIAGALITPGFVWLYEWNGTAWNYQSRLEGPAGRHIGYDIALDGNYLATTGGTLTASASIIDGVYVFERTGGSWLRSELAAPDRTANDSFGFSVGLSGDTICVGAPAFQSTTPGAVHVFRRSGSTWTQEGPKLAPMTNASARVGKACAIGGDTLVAATPYFVGGQPGSGRAFIYARSGATWSLAQSLLPAADTFLLGDAAAVAGDGVIVGASGTSTLPRALMFARTGATWTERLRGESPVAGASYGTAAASDGATIVVAGRREGARPGVLTFYVPSSAAPSGPPGAPTAFQASVSGTTVSMSWGAPSTGGPVTGYTLVARTSAGGPVIVALPVGNTTSFSVVAPNGTFVLSVTASNASGTGPESAQATVTSPQAVAPPGPPSGLGVAVTGASAAFTWAAPSTGGTPTGYTLLAGLTPAFSAPIASLPLPAAPQSVSIGGIPPGTYYVRLVATNAGGTSPASNEVSLTVAGASPPGAPTLNAPQVTGATVTLSWAAGSGGPPAAFTLAAALSTGGTPIVTVPLTGTAVSFTGVPAGRYFLRLTASNAAGTSAPSNEVVLVVP